VGRRDAFIWRGDVRLDSLQHVLPTTVPTKSIWPPPGDKLDVAVSRGDKLVVLKPSAPASNVLVSLFDPRYSLGFSPATFANSTPLQDPIIYRQRHRRSCLR